MFVTIGLLSFQDLMNREKKDKIPSMQVSFIDAICTQLYQVLGGPASCPNLPLLPPGFPGRLKVCVPLQTLAGLSEYCSPLLEGCQKNRQQWKHLAEECEKALVNGLV